MSTATATHTVEAIAKDLVSKCRKGDFESVKHDHYADDVESIEAMSMPDKPAVVHGLKAVLAKGKEWAENTEVHKMEVSDALVSDNEFAVRFTMDATCKQTKQRSKMSELAIYEVRNGKIIRERFVYNCSMAG
jgi:ketosteroid isomerase-like protein